MAEKSLQVQKHAGGRPESISGDILAKLRSAFMIGCTEEEACLFARINPATLYRHKQRHPEFCKEIELLRHHPKLKARITIQKNLNDPKVAAWYLERKAKDEFSAEKDDKNNNPNKSAEQAEQIDQMQSIIHTLSSDAKTGHNQPN